MLIYQYCIGIIDSSAIKSMMKSMNTPTKNARQNQQIIIQTTRKSSKKKPVQVPSHNVKEQIDMIKAFVKYFTNKKANKEHIQSQIQRLKQYLPVLRERIEQRTEKKTQIQANLATTQVSTMDELENLNQQIEDADCEYEEMKKKTEENNLKVKLYKENQAKIEKLNKQIQQIEQIHKIEFEGIQLNLNNLKKEKIIKKATLVAKTQDAQKIVVVNEQKQAIEKIKQSKNQFAKYHQQLAQIHQTKTKEKQNAFNEVNKFVMEKSFKELQEYRQKVNDDIKTIERKMGQTQNVEDFLALLKFANIPILMYSLTEQEEAYLDKFYRKHFKLQNLYSIQQQQVQQAQSYDQLSNMQQEISMRSQQMSNEIKTKDEQVELMQGKYAEIIMKLMTLTDRSSHTN